MGSSQITDAWPTPDQSTIEKAAMVIVEESGYETEAGRAVALAEVLADPAFNLIVSTIWDGRLPAPDAYHRADAAWSKRMAQVNRIASVLNSWQRWREQADEGSPFAELFDQVLSALDQPAEG